MKQLLKVKIAGLPPSVNHIYKAWGRSAPIKAKAVKEWQESVAAIMADAWKRKHRATWEKPVSVALVYQTRDRRRWDLDNRFKAMLDTLMMARVIADDSQIVKLSAERIQGDVTETTLTLGAV